MNLPKLLRLRPEEGGMVKWDGLEGESAYYYAPAVDARIAELEAEKLELVEALRYLMRDLNCKCRYPSWRMDKPICDHCCAKRKAEAVLLKNGVKLP